MTSQPKRKYLTIDLNNLKIISKNEYEYEKDDKKFLIKTKKNLNEIAKISYLILPELFKKDLIEINDEPNRIKIEKRRRLESILIQNKELKEETKPQKYLTILEENKQLQQELLDLHKKYQELQNKFNSGQEFISIKQKRKFYIRGLKKKGYEKWTISIGKRFEYIKNIDDNKKLWKALVVKNNILRFINIETSLPLENKNLITFYISKNKLNDREFTITDDEEFRLMAYTLKN